MRLLTKTLLAAAAIAAMPMAANAESQYVSGSGSANARLDFQVTVPRILFLQVGTGADGTTNPAIDQISFVVPAASLGNGTAVAATAGSGDVGNGTVTAKVLGNNGTITFTSTTLGALENGAGDSISYSEVNTAVAPLTSATPLQHPTLADGATTTLTLSPATGKLVQRDAQWTYTYANSVVAAPGTYGGVNTNNSRVTYTAAMP